MSSPYEPGLQNPYGAPVSKPAPPAPGDYSGYRQPPAKSWVWLALLGGHLGAAAYFLFGLGALVFVALAASEALPAPEASADQEAAAAAVIFGLAAAMCMGLGLIAEIVTIGMHLRHKWAWFAGLVMFGLYLPSLFLPIGALGMCGLLMNGSRQEFGLS